MEACKHACKLHASQGASEQLLEAETSEATSSRPFLRKNSSVPGFHEGARGSPQVTTERAICPQGSFRDVLAGLLGEVRTIVCRSNAFDAELHGLQRTSIDTAAGSEVCLC